MTLGELESVYQKIIKDFEEGEYSPLDVLHRQIESGVQEGLIFCEDETDVGYAICAANNETGYLLLSLMAINKECRGRKIGGELLIQLRDYFADKNGIIVEVERPQDAQNQSEKKVRESRIGFYERVGFRFVNGINYVIWDVPMHLMIWDFEVFENEHKNNDAKNEYSAIADAERVVRLIYEIYFTIMGPRHIHKLEVSISSDML